MELSQEEKIEDRKKELKEAGKKKPSKKEKSDE